MKTLRRIILSVVPLLVISAVLLAQPEGTRQPVGTGTGGRSPAGDARQPGETDRQGAEILPSGPVTPGVSPPVRALPAYRWEPTLDREVVARRLPLFAPLNVPEEELPDPLLARTPLNPGASPDLNFSFEGLSRFDGGAVPPDTMGEVGPNHYVQMVNVAFAVYDKQGNRLTGPTGFNQLFAGNPQTPNCAVANDGDPVAVYDPLADRWLLSQFAGVYSGDAGLCIAVSQTPDPTGAYHLYEFTTGVLPDYFKIGVWPDAYYVSANESTYTAYALDRASMLAGNPATFQKVSGETNLLLPADLDGPTAPPAGAPGLFYTFKNESFGGAARLEIFAFDVDWNTPANSQFALIDTIPVTPFNYTVCGFFIFDCIPQKDSTQRVDSISEWPMWRLQYRNFGTYETLVGNFTVDVGGDRAGIRWFELRRNGGDWTLHQEGTHAPGDGHHRWLGSMAMDGNGNIALGYSVSSTSLYPAIRYATRLAGDPPGSLQSEATLQEGSGSQTNYNRWGDYSSLTVDPADDCTFWYTNQYYTDLSFDWRTRIGTFRVPGCQPMVDVGVYLSHTPEPVIPGQQITYTASVVNHSALSATDLTFVDELPVETTLVSFAPTTGCTSTDDGITCDLGTLTAGAERTITVVASVNLDTEPGLILNRAAVSAAEPDPMAGNNEAVETAQVSGVTLSGPELAWTTAGNGTTIQVEIVNVQPITDTFDLALSGQSWPTNLSTSALTLGPGETATFNVTSDAPPTAQVGESNRFTVTARSRSAPTVEASLPLEVTVGATVYLPALHGK